MSTDKVKWAQSLKQNKPRIRVNVFKAGDLAREARKLAKDLNIETIIPEDVACLTTGFQSIDDALTAQIGADGMTRLVGTGKGLPRGRLIEIYGAEATVKTSLAMSVIAQAQARGELTALIDAEHALDSSYVRAAFGVDTDALIHTFPDYGEQALEQAKQLLRAGVSVVVIDSVAALVPKEELDGGKAMGLQARMMSKFCREVTTILKPGGPTLICINQIRKKLGVFFGPSDVTSGGNALKFYASIRIKVAHKKQLTVMRNKEKVKIGSRVELETVKNKVGSPHGRTQFDVLHGKGISIPVVGPKKKRATKKQ